MYMLERFFFANTRFNWFILTRWTQRASYERIPVLYFEKRLVEPLVTLELQMFKSLTPFQKPVIEVKFLKPKKILLILGEIQ